MSKTVSFQTIQFNISTQYSSIWSIDKTLSGATTPDHSGPASNGNEGVLRIPQNPSITGTSLSDFLVSYSGHCWIQGRTKITPMYKNKNCFFSSLSLLPEICVWVV